MKKKTFFGRLQSRKLSPLKKLKIFLNNQYIEVIKKKNSIEIGQENLFYLANKYLEEQLWY